ncbi:hypothetical protein M595_3186 [Lyngbya aestuarii BL J]|uniref:Uncharacterized protein n=2 Tax=Lyngbya aestuarii TaxID=118322 RepID=U7QHV4_9CYAN|nr:hypothetical protein M595_3186 [Lyngbya aestuarii BL J]
MNSDLNSLKFSEDELDNLMGFSPESLTVSLCRNEVIRQTILGKIWGDYKKLFSLISTELISLFLSLVLAGPLMLLLLDRTITPDVQATLPFLLKAIALSIVITLGVNLGVGFKLKPLRNVLYLMEEVKKYNDTVKAVEILDQFSKTESLEDKLVNRAEVIQALQITRNSLVSAFQTERIIREHQDFIDRRYELFAHLENNLTTLMTFNVNNQANEYGQLLNEALQIGMSVHREIEKLKQN